MRIRADQWRNFAGGNLKLWLSELRLKLALLSILSIVFLLASLAVEQIWIREFQGELEKVNLVRVPLTELSGAMASNADRIEPDSPAEYLLARD